MKNIAPELTSGQMVPPKEPAIYDRTHARTPE